MVVVDDAIVLSISLYSFDKQTINGLVSVFEFKNVAPFLFQFFYKGANYEISKVNSTTTAYNMH